MPGGWVEFQDWDGYPITQDGSLSGTRLQEFFNEVYGTFEEAGYEVRSGVKLEQWFKDAGFVNIHVEKFIIPYRRLTKGSPSRPFLPFASKQ